MSGVYANVDMCVESMLVWVCVWHVCECGYVSDRYVNMRMFMVRRSEGKAFHLETGFVLFLSLCVRIDGPRTSEESSGSVSHLVIGLGL